MVSKALDAGLNLSILAVVGLLMYVAGTIISPRLGDIEGGLFPVSQVTVFQIVGVAENGDAIVAGRFNKLRDCNFVRSQWYKGSGLEIEFERVDEVQELPAGEGLPWGAIRLRASVETAKTDIYVEGYHKCHPFWMTKTVTWRSP